MKSLLIVFVKNPVKGRVKTRLAASVGDEKALRVYKYLLRHTYSVVSAVKTDKEIWYSDRIEKNDEWALQDTKARIQPPGDLGQKMSCAFRTGFENGYRKIVIIGSDCLQLQVHHIEQAFRLLGDSDVVTGPSGDGGYYLLGMKQWHPVLFRDKPWSTRSLYGQTLAVIAEEGLSLSELEVLNDIDTLEDLESSDIDAASV